MGRRFGDVIESIRETSINVFPPADTNANNDIDKTLFYSIRLLKRSKLLTFGQKIFF